MTSLLRAASIALLLFAVPLNPVRGQTVRVRILDLDEPVTVRLSAHGAPLRLFAGDHAEPLMELPAGASARISRASEQLHVAVDDMALYARSLRVEPRSGGLFGIEVEENAVAQERRRYAGRLFVSADGDDWAVQLVNEVTLDEYVASVVASEYGFDDIEGTKAMAVLVRTYTLGVLGKYGSEYDHVDHTLSQVYRGADAVTDLSRQAAKATEGEVIRHGNDLVRAVYFSSSGGHTADNETVWDGPALSYLRGKPDPYGGASPHAHWTTRLSRPDLLAELRTSYGASVSGFLIGTRSREGRVETVELIREDGRRTTISSNDFRILLTQRFGARAVRSTLFDVRREGNEYVFDGKGFGHGVGLSQWGAHDMAQRGMTYTEILDFYYSDVRLAHLDATGQEAARDAVAVDMTAADDAGTAGHSADDIPIVTATAADTTAVNVSALDAPRVPTRIVRSDDAPADDAPPRRRRVGW